MIELENLLNICDDSIKNYFIEMYKLLNPEVVKNVFEEIESRESRSFYMKDEYLRRYSINYDAIGEVLNNNRNR